MNGWQLDSVVTSPYKWYGPHAGVQMLQPDLMHGVEPYRVRPADYDGPDRWETGTKSFETIAGIGGAVSFMAETPWHDVMAAEGQLLERLESGLRAIPGVTVYGPAAFEGRAPTTIFNLDGRDPAHVAHELAERKIAVWSGDNYACELIDALGLREAAAPCAPASCATRPLTTSTPSSPRSKTWPDPQPSRPATPNLYLSMPERAPTGTSPRRREPRPNCGAQGPSGAPKRHSRAGRVFAHGTTCEVVT